MAIQLVGLALQGSQMLGAAKDAAQELPKMMGMLQSSMGGANIGDTLESVIKGLGDFGEDQFSNLAGNAKDMMLGGGMQGMEEAAQFLMNALSALQGLDQSGQAGQAGNGGGRGGHGVHGGHRPHGAHGSQSAHGSQGSHGMHKGPGEFTAMPMPAFGNGPGLMVDAGYAPGQFKAQPTTRDLSF